MTESETKILVTGEKFVGGGFRSIEAVTEEIILNTKHELLIATFILTSDKIFDLLEEIAAKGVKITLILNKPEDLPISIKNRIQRFSQIFPAVRVIDFFTETGSQLHAKAIVSDRRKAIVGSANLTWPGMVKNYEVALCVKGRVAADIAELFERLLL
jgi:phosphatidylserine/phosphatidylglycerophosphate/cardiolipin synthase-like enzyme